ncbi:MAG: rhodanese-like domain-containing protein [Deltaproteobacteria bacterium]|nr:MAG: rhodanese-like domain-containing protein [Deltaproteobacteria bacterium]
MLFGLFRNPRNLEEARRLVDEGALLVDVRTPAEFAAGHVEGAKNIPVQELPQRLRELGDPSRPVVLYCRSGARSASAARLLAQHGFTKVVDVGPMPPW